MINPLQGRPPPAVADDDPRVMQLAAAIQDRHGPVQFRRGRKGLHLEFPSPEALDRDGEVELMKRHGSLNVDKYLRRPPYENLTRSAAIDRSAQCMKYGVRYSIDALLRWPTLAERDLPTPSPRTIRPAKPRPLTKDVQGNDVPFPAGDVVSLLDLPDDHPCLKYVRARRYDPKVLVAQFDAGFCVRELPRTKENQRFYRALPGGFRETPQGRLVFRGKTLGVDRGWQARILDYKDEKLGRQAFLHPDTLKWVWVLIRRDDGKWTLRDDWATQFPDLAWNPSRYMTAAGSLRGELLLGFDQAIAWNRLHRPPCAGFLAILTEGPLDAAKFGAPAMPILGSSLSDGQASLLRMAGFRTIVYAGQRDEKKANETESASDRAIARARVEVSEWARFIPFLPPDGFKDFGEMLDETPESLHRQVLALLSQAA